MTKKATKPTSKVGSVFDLPAKSWQIVKKNWQMFAVVNFFALLSAVLAIFKPQPVKHNAANRFADYDASGFFSGQHLAAILGVGSFLLVVFIILSVFLYTMSISLELRAGKGKKPTFDTLLDDGKKYWLRLFGLTIASGVIVLAGLILFIIPGLIALTRLLFAPYIMLEKDLGIEESMRRSNEMAKGNAGPIWAAIGLTILIAIGASILGAIPHVGKLLATIVTIAFSLVIVLRYLELKGTIKVKS